VSTEYVEKLLKDIQVKNVENGDVEVINHSPLVMIGKGRQGAVFRYSDDICVKVYGNTEDCEREHYALYLGQQSDFFPLLYAAGDNYIVMETIKGVDLREYLQSQPLSEELSYKLIQLLITFKEIGYDRIDHHKRQIYLQPDGQLKVIDVGRTVWRDRVYPYPRKLLTSLGVKNKAKFLSHVKLLAPELYGEWEHYMRMEYLSREIYHVLLRKKTNKDTLSALAKRVLLTKDEQAYVSQLESLVRKVFKEEWVKTMLAKGIDPDKVMDAIDKHWERAEKDFNLKLKEKDIDKKTD
jgi:predicted Ser/Thr protein kinase